VGVAPAERVVIERKFKLRFSVDPAFIVKLGRAISLILTKYPRNINFGKIVAIPRTDNPILAISMKY